MRVLVVNLVACFEWITDGNGSDVDNRCFAFFPVDEWISYDAVA